MSSPAFVPASDEDQRRQALDPVRSFIVQAPAGSGKTELLIQRHLRLLSVAERPEGVVAITFTIKAAGEMRERLLGAMRDAREGKDPGRAHERVTRDLALSALARDRERGWNLLENPSRLRVQTIDALCSSIVAQMPWLARLGSVPDIQEKAAGLYADAARRTVQLLEADRPESAPLETLFEHLDNDAGKVRTLLAGMLERRDQWIGIAFQSSDDRERRVLEMALEGLIEQAQQQANHLIPLAERPNILNAMQHRARHLPSCADCQVWPSTETAQQPVWVGLAQLLLTDLGEWRKQLTVGIGFPPKHKQAKDDCMDCILRLRQVAGLREALRDIAILPPPRYTDRQWAITRAVLECLKLAVAQLRLVFAERGEADFGEIALAAGLALGAADDPSDLSLRLDSRIEHLLVDEFQDTSMNQFDLIAKLLAGWSDGDGRTLFLVGDPMQSIYRFRKAEVSLFLDAQAGAIEQVRLESLRLTANYRSVPEIVERANDIFSQVFPPVEDSASGAIPYARSQAATAPSGGPAVFFHALEDKDDAAEAAQTVALVRQARQRRPDGTIAILVRARPHLVAIVAALKREGVAYRALEIDPLAERTVVRDLQALTRALLHPADRIAWLAILRAPWCGLSLADLHALASEQKPFVWDLLRDVTALSQDGQVRAVRLRVVMEGAFAERGRWPLRRWVERVWRHLGGPACVDAGGRADASDFLDLLEKHQSGADLPDLDLLPEWLEDLFAQPDPRAPETLQILTIHKAKGLQFDTVIVPGMGKTGKSDEGQLILFHERRGVSGSVERLIAPSPATGVEKDPIYEYLKKVEHSKASNERKRQIYVALTRARHELHLLGAAEVSARGGTAPRGGSFLRDIWGAILPAERAQFEAAAAGGVRNTAADKPIPVLRRLASDWARPELPTPVSWTGSAEAGAEMHDPSFEWVRDDLRHAGTVVHGLLQRVARGGSANVETAVIRSALGQLGVGPADLDKSTRRVREAVARTLATDRGKWILHPHREARCEYAVSGVLDGQVVRGTIDRTFLDEQGTRWIIDYKTSAHEGGGMEVFVDDQVRRYGDQLDRYARLLEPLGQPVRVGLYFPLLDEWREWAARPAVAC